ncbi:FMN-binding negative transcriptional regulator [Sporolactobacillus pectinivorans]|uniref:FMN-binding negative transcriptional regulator n=1 Tax=Sporolactobacillus pectinivorans TaxID=1591408 RepID=UPI000C258659|nr:FMN-binding negative transcriptional regulator [Sporolactobacillus pectinivorans]
MYIPEHFKMTTDEDMFKMIEQNSFATLFSQHHGAPYATHLPVTLNRKKRLLCGHFARSNPQWEDIGQQEILAVFQGPHRYISPSWYETNTAVPTWNYVAVHIYGQVELITDPKELMNTLNAMVQKYEKPGYTYKLTDVNPAFVNKLFNGIVGFKIKINRMEGKQKLSQNNPEERQKRIIEHLKAIKQANENEMAQMMENNLNKKARNNADQ